MRIIPLRKKVATRPFLVRGLVNNPAVVIIQVRKHVLVIRQPVNGALGVLVKGLIANALRKVVIQTRDLADVTTQVHKHVLATPTPELGVLGVLVRWRIAHVLVDSNKVETVTNAVAKRVLVPMVFGVITVLVRQQTPSLREIVALIMV